jgi:hypothetical protein
MSSIDGSNHFPTNDTVSNRSSLSDSLTRTDPKAKSLYQESSAGFFMKFSGFLAGAAATAAILAKVLTIGAATSAALVTPFGWAALACLGVGLAIIATKNFLDKNPQILESIKDAVKDFGKWCAGTICITGIFILAIIISPFFLFLDGCGGGGGGSSDGKKPESKQNQLQIQNNNP